MLRILSLLVLFISLSHGANILAILPTPSYSHQIAFTHIWKELSLRGHKVTVLTTDPIKDPKLTNLTELDMKWSYSVVAEIGKLSQTAFSMWTAHELSQSLLLPVAEAQLAHPDIQNLIHNKDLDKEGQFDVVLVEFLYPEFLAFAEIYNCPKILFATLDAWAITHYFMGNPVHPILNPDMGASFHGPLSFKERVTSTLYTLYTLYFYNFKAYHKRTRVVKEFFNSSKTVHELVNDVDMLFLNVNPILQPIRAVGPSTVLVGGNRDVVKSVPLTKDIAEFLDNAKEGFIYFSLGSNVKSEHLIKETREAITEALRELPYKVLWKFEADELPNQPENVKIIKWAPQQTILAHPNIKVFVTQGGLQSFEEAFYRGVPFVVIPFFGDQEQNARIMENKDIAVVVNRRPSVDKIQLKKAILEVINNPKYRNNVNRLRQLALDTPMTGLEKAIWWTEYVIRNKGAKHLRNPAADIPFYQYFLLDVIGFLILVIAAAFSLFYITFRTIYRYAKLFIYRSVPVHDLKTKKLK